MGYGGLWQLRTGGEGTLSERREPERYDEAVHDGKGFERSGGVESGRATQGKAVMDG
jgi:hypothetical protein